MLTEPTIYLIDDDPGLLNLLRVAVEGQGWHARCYSSSRAFLESGDPLRYGCVVTDVKMPDVSGFDLLDQLVSRDVTVPVIMMTGQGDIPTGVLAMKRGAINFLEKPFPIANLLAAIREALEHNAARLNSQEAAREFFERLAQLSNEERQVLGGIVLGHSNQEIASQLDLSLRTVQFRRQGLMQKMAVRTRAELMRKVLDARWNPNSDNGL